MGFISKAESASNDPRPAPDAITAESNAKNMGGSDAVHDADTDPKGIPDATSNYQAGVRQIEAITTVWTKRDMIAAYGM